MEINKINKISSYIGFALKSNHIVIGAENLSKVTKKLYLIIKDNSAGNNLNKIAERIAKLTDCQIYSFSSEEMFKFTNLKDVKVIGIKSKSLSNAIEKTIKE